MKIAIGCDHGGYELKEHLVAFLKEKGYRLRNIQQRELRLSGVWRGGGPGGGFG